MYETTSNRPDPAVGMSLICAVLNRLSDSSQRFM